MREEARLWIDDALRTFKIAKENYSLGFYDVSVFLCQQSLEKMLKGSLIALRKGQIVKTHKLFTLYKRVANRVHLSDELINFLKHITPFYTITRYPDVSMGLPIDVISDKFAEECIEKTGKILSCFQKVILKQ